MHQVIIFQKNLLTNEDLSKTIDTSDEWIKTRTGIKTRYIAGKEEKNSDFCYEVSKKILEKSKISSEEIDLIIIATFTPDKIFPNTACILQKKLKAKNAVCFSLEAACSGFIYALEVGVSLVTHFHYKNALIIGSEKLSSFIDWQDRHTAVYLVMVLVLC